MSEVPELPAPLDVNASMRDMNLAQQEQARRKSIIIQRAREGYSVGEQSRLAGVSRRTHSDYRNDDPVFLAEWQRATDECSIRDLERTKMARGRRRLRAELGAIGVQAGLQTVAKLYSLEGQVAPTADMEAQAKEDPVGFIAKTIMAAKVADDLDARAFGLDEKEKTEESSGQVPTSAGDPEAPSPDLDGFLSRDLGLAGDQDYKRDVAGGIYRRAFWTLRHCFRDDVRRVVMAIGKGGGKSICISLTLAREFQKLLAVRDSAHPRRGVLNLSASGGDQAEMAVFTDLRRWLRGPWFARLGPPAREAGDHVEWALPSGGVVCAHSGNSRSEGVEGIDWTAAGADEVCRLPERDNTRILSAAGLVGPVEDTMVSRCQAGGTYKLLVASWPEHQGDYLLSRDEKDPGQIEMARRTGVKEDLTRSFLGEPITWAGGDAETKRQAALAEPPFCDYGTEVFISQDGTFVVHCPMWQVRPDADLDALRASHARDRMTFSARFGAWPVAESRTPFLVDPSIVTQRANHARIHPCDDGGQFLDWFRGSAEFLYYAHIDAAVTRDRAGIAVAHYDQGRCVFDLLLEVEPPGNGAELQLESLRQVLYAMDARGFVFAKVTCDGFEGFSMRQELEAHGLDAEYMSVDKTREAYENWRDGLREGKMDYYPSEALQACADSLIDTGKKVDHTPNGRKDLSDAMCAVYLTIMREHGGSTLIGHVE